MFNHNKLKATIDDGFQPELVIYNVMPDMHKIDISRGIVQNGVYPKNPTAKDIRDMIHGNYIGNKNTNGLFTYAIDMDGNIIVGKRFNVQGCWIFVAEKYFPLMTEAVISSPIQNHWKKLPRYLLDYPKACFTRTISEVNPNDRILEQMVLD